MTITNEPEAQRLIRNQAVPIDAAKWYGAQAEIAALHAELDRCVATLREYIAAADYSAHCPDGDSIAAMVRFGEADAQARALLARVSALEGKP